MRLKLSDDEGKLLLKLARQSISQDLSNRNFDIELLKSNMSQFVINEKRGIFVTLHLNKQLRGCIGNIEPIKTIYTGVLENAKQSAFHDTRFRPVTYEEFNDIHIEVSILTKPEPISYTDTNDLIGKLKPFIDGVIVKKRYQSATFLPQVWEQLKVPHDFLSHLCSKAGLSPNEWEKGEVDILTYQVQIFEENS